MRNSEYLLFYFGKGTSVEHVLREEDFKHIADEACKYNPTDGHRVVLKKWNIATPVSDGAAVKVIGSHPRLSRGILCRICI